MFEFINGKEFEIGGDSLHVHKSSRSLARVLYFVLGDLLDTLGPKQQSQVKTSRVDPCHVMIRNESKKRTRFKKVAFSLLIMPYIQI